MMAAHDSLVAIASGTSSSLGSVGMEVCVCVGGALDYSSYIDNKLL